MSAFTIDVLKSEEIKSLLSLQKENLIQNLLESESSNTGFLTFQYSEKAMADMMEDMPQPIARSNNEIVGYALATSCEAGSKMELLKPLLEVCKSLEYNDKSLSKQKFYLLGQVCVKEGHRGAGIFDALYAKHKELFSVNFDCVVTEIAVTNHRSLAAHTRVGFKILAEYEDNNRDWYVVAWDLK
jgi:hypothetical protein